MSDIVDRLRQIASGLDKAHPFTVTIAQAAARIEELERAADTERERIVAWLRAHECSLMLPPGAQEPYDEAADAIERGYHLGDGRAAIGKAKP